VDAVVSAGGIPLIIPVGLSEPDMKALFERIDGLLLPGGGDVEPGFYTDDEPHASLRGLDDGRDQLEIFMAREAVSKQKPILAICRGHQVFNVAFGGTLWQDLNTQVSSEIVHDHVRGNPRFHLQHRVDVRHDTKLAHCLASDRVGVNSLHHQGIRELAPELVATAVAPDGLIEGVEVPEHPFALGVQWHPEDLIHDHESMLALFEGLIEAARTYKVLSNHAVGD
jgi:putative glutamine amidotransferase